MRTAFSAVLLSVIFGAMAREQLLFLRRRREDTATGTKQQDGTEPRNVMRVQEGDVASFTCAAASHEPMSVEWRHNGSLIHHAAGDGRNSSKSSVRVWHAPLSSVAGPTLTRSRLRLTNVSANHTGEYACHFSDGLGTLSRTSHLVVRPKTPTPSEVKDILCGPNALCSDKGKVCDDKNHCQCPDGSTSKDGSCPTVYSGPHIASILAWVLSAAAAAILLAALAVVAVRRIRRTAGSTLLENAPDDDGWEEENVSRRTSFITMTLSAHPELA